MRQPEVITIEGQLCLSSSAACFTLSCNTRQLSVWRQEGMPYHERKGRYWYPINRVHAWFRGEAV